MIEQNDTFRTPRRKYSSRVQSVVFTAALGVTTLLGSEAHMDKPIGGFDELVSSKSTPSVHIPDISGDQVIAATAITGLGILSEHSGGGKNIHIRPVDMGCYEGGLCNILIANPSLGVQILQLLSE